MVPSTIDEKTLYEKVYEASLQLLYHSTPEETYATIVEKGMELIGGKFGSIFLEEDGELKRVYASHPDLYTLSIRKRGITWKTYKTQNPYIISHDIVEEIHPEFKEIPIGSDLNVPLTYNNKTFGVLSILLPEHVRFTKQDLHQLQLFSPLASLALRNMQLYHQLTKAVEERDLFISMAAHELKTPLTSITVYAQLLSRMNKKQITSAALIKKNLLSEIGRLTKLVNELLQASQIERGSLKFTMKKNDLIQIVQKAITEFMNAHTNNPIILTNKLKTKTLYLKCDADKLRQVFSNLFINAAKFSPKDTAISVTLKQKASEITIEVKDQGVGIPKKNLKRIFERFYKGQTSKREGLGLGLFIVKEIIDHHKGSLTIKSTVNKGTTFSIVLPYSYHD